MTARKLVPIRPGEVLLSDFLEPLDISRYRLAHDIRVPARRINEFVHGKRGITADIGTGGGAKRAWFKDTEGNIVAIIQTV